MSQKKKIDTKDLVDKIEKLMKKKMSEETVVSLDSFRELKRPQDNQTILVIEDDETMRGALRRILEGEGYKVKTAADGTQLSSVLDDNPVDLIILDVGLPWINGFELAQLLKEHSDLKKIPLIFVSGKTSDEDVRRGFAVGADDYIKKPFDIEKIQKTVRTLLKLTEPDKK
jgi:two-component system aerobic respiration control protein ArcA